MMHVEIIGPGEFRYGARDIKLRPLEKVILIAVYVAGGRRSMARLVEDVWRVPTSGSAATLRGCLSKARAKVIAAGGTADQLSRTIKVSGGSSIVAIPHSWDVDISVFQRHAADAASAYESGRFADARSSALAARTMWYHDPLPDAGKRDFAAALIVRLTGIHLATTITWIKAEICLGRHREMIAELKELSRLHPAEDEIAMLLATALYRTARVPDAAMACRQAIAARESNGIDAVRLQALQHAILNETAPPTGPLGW